MRREIAILPVVLIFAVCGCAVLSGLSTSVVVVKDLRCEYRVNPLGIDELRPRLSWIIQCKQRGWKQGAYRVLVASTAELLKLNVGNLWDSGKVDSDQSIQVEYAGRPLGSRMRCYWKVRVWDKAGRVSRWSEPAYWTMGLINPKDWQAKWIGYDAEPPASYRGKEPLGRLSLEGCPWVWYPQGEPARGAPVGVCFFRRAVEFGPGEKTKRGRFRMAADNEAVLFVNGQKVGQVSGCKSGKTFDITDKLIDGRNSFAIAAKNVGDGPSQAALAGKIVLESAAGDKITILIDRLWKVSKTEQEGWQGPYFDDSSWLAAKEVAGVGDQPRGRIEQGELILPPPPYLRKSFWLDRPIKRAMVYATALGVYELHINGQRVGEDYFTPGWTDYPTRVYYQSYDVTDLVRRGDNAVGAILADGWYAGYVGFGRKRQHYGDKPRLLVQLEIEYADGGRGTIVTDKSWRASYAAHLEADFLMGETYDATKEIPGWDMPGFDDCRWGQVAVTEKLPSKVQSYPGVTVKKMLEIKPQKLAEPKEGVYVFDMGQNFAGWVRLKVKGKAGTKVVLRFAEMLNPDGTIYTKNLRSARCTDSYILKGKGKELWEPRFTYHGFRYVQVTGYPGQPKLDALTGIVAHSDTPAVGYFECSNGMVNQLWHNITWSQRSNFMEVPTDCPQRDERLGWTGDAQIFIRTATYNMDVAAFFTKWLVDLVDAQNENGAFPDVAPRKVALGDGVPAWGDAGVICPWTIYTVYGDRRVIERHYEAMKKWIGYLKTNSKGLLRPAYGYGDWVSIGSQTPKDVIATAYFAYSTRLLSRMAAVLGKQADAQKYGRLFEQIKEAFNKAYVSEDGRIKGDTQTCYCLGLYFDLLAGQKGRWAAQHLVEAIKRKNWHLSTGFVGASYLLPSLAQTGHLDIAYRLLNNETFPSWGYSIKNQATTIWERWDGWTEEKGFQDPGMNSFNHYAFGSVGRWLFGTVAGIDTGVPGYKRIIIRPRPGGGLSYARARYKSIHGQIVSDWRIKGGTFTLKITIPANTTATVYVPAKDVETITESGRPAGQAEGVRFVRMADGGAVFAVGSGDYQFVSKLPD